MWVVKMKYNIPGMRANTKGLDYLQMLLKSSFYYLITLHILMVDDQEQEQEIAL